MEYTEALLRLEAYNLQTVYVRNNIALQAMINRQADATDKDGRFIVQKTEELYDAQAEIDKITGKQQRKVENLQSRYDRMLRAKATAKRELEKKKGAK